MITGSVEVSPGIGLADAIFDIVSSGSTLVSNRLKEVEVVMKSEALLIGNKNMSEEKKEVLEELLFRMNAVKTAEDKKICIDECSKRQTGRNHSCIARYEESYSDAIGTGRLVFCSYST